MRRIWEFIPARQEKIDSGTHKDSSEARREVRASITSGLGK